MTNNTPDLRRIVYVVYDTDKNLGSEIEMMREAPGVRVEEAHSQDELVKALRVPSSVTIISAHGFHANDVELWGFSRYDKVTPPLRPADLFDRAGTIGASNLIAIACDTRWARETATAPTIASAEWDQTNTRGRRVFITQGEIRYTASRGFLKHLLALIADDPHGDLDALILQARRQFGYSLKPGTGRVRIIEHIRSA